MIDGGNGLTSMVDFVAQNKLTIVGAHCPFNPLDQLAETKVKQLFKDPQLNIVTELEYTSGDRGLIEKFTQDSKDISGYSLLLLRKNVVIHIILFGNTGSVNPDDIQQLKEIILNRIP